MSKASSGKRIVLNSIIYSFSGLLLKCFSFFLVPLYTAYLTTEDYGITTICTSFISAMSFVVSFSLFSAVKRFYVEYKDDPEKLSRFYGTVFTFVLLSGTAFFGILTAFQNVLSHYVFSGIDYYPVILVSLISLVFGCQHTVFDNILKSQQKAMKSAVFSIAYFLVTVAGNIVFVVILRMGAVGSLLATMIGNVLYTGYFVIEMHLQKTIRFCLDGTILKEALRYSIPIMPHNLSTHITTLISNVLIGGSASLSAVGIYSVAAQFGVIADTVHSYVSQAYGPWLYEKLHDQEQDFKSSIRSISKMLISVIGLLLLGIALFAQDYVVLLVDKAYVTAWRYVPLIVLVYAVKTMYYFYVEVLFYYKKASRVLFVATLSSSLLNLAFSAFLIPAMGAYGSILADGIAMVIRVGIVVYISKRFDDVGLKIKDFAVNFLIVAAFVAGGLVLSVWKYSEVFSLVNFGYKILVVLAYVALMIVRNKQALMPHIRRFLRKMKKEG